MPRDESLESPPPASGFALRADSLLGSLTIVLILAVIQRALGFVREVLLCRWLDQDELGQWALAFVFLMTGAAAVSFGLQGSMNRYVEYYRRRGQLRAYLRRITTASCLLAGLAASGLWAFRDRFSELIFGRGDCQLLVSALAATLAIVVANHFLLDFFTAQRLFRVVSLMQFANGVLFVIFSIALLVVWRTDAMAVLVGFAASYFTVACVAGGLAWGVTRRLPNDTAHLSNASFWPHIVRASAALWGYNCLFNLFEVVDRYMLVHCSTLDEQAALAAVGDYHSARVVPYLLTTAAGLIASTLMPHWSHAWEAGRRQEVAVRQRLALKLMAGGMVFAAVLVLTAAPLLFEVAFAGKYRAGQDVLPWVLATAIWTGLVAVAFNYLWCVERLGICAATLAVGVGVNMALNYWWIPQYGLLGAVLATAVGQFVQLTLVYHVSRAYGMRLDAGLWLLTASPALLGLGVWAAIGGVAAIGILAWRGNLLFNREERTLLESTVTRIVDRVRRGIAERRLAG